MTRPTFPKRAVITGGMPYGEKQLHFGHIGGVFVQADIFARFLRCRLGEDNVIFVSGTDCYGAGVVLGYEKAVEGGFAGTIHDFVRRNHDLQKATMDAYGISLNLYAASALDNAGEIHAALSTEVFNQLVRSGHMSLSSAVQFYDEERGVFLNGRQVRGRCPIQGCKSDIAYADECSLGHQYDPSQLIAPISVLSGQAPVQREVKNWYFDLPAYTDHVGTLLAGWEGDPLARDVLTRVVREFMRKPSIFVKRELLDEIAAIPAMPTYETIAEEGKVSAELIFADLATREVAVELLSAKSIRYRTGKTLVPLRISGNLEWGVPVPPTEEADDLTFWVWPESLWAPISFTQTVLGEDGDWRDWWASPDARVYQFIGEDNIYFYAIAQGGLWSALGGLPATTVVPNHHLLYGKSKASSSGEIKPPSADELLEHYTPEQLRMHFFNASLGDKSVSFEPLSVMNPDSTAFDPVLNEGNLLTNVFNRLVRSAFYTLQKLGDSVYPDGAVSADTVTRATDTIITYENHMANLRFDRIFDLLNIYLRDANKDWSVRSKSEDAEEIRQLLRDTFHVIRTAAALLWPVAPQGCEMIAEHLGAPVTLWDWEHIFRPLDQLLSEGHEFKFLEPRVDFFVGKRKE
ncbi:MAG: class I tRNA ligase family protein [Oscillospiraceae bacterium]|nr:class I tRNA ligase family protein [Oscillospiraceae bacterium]